MGKGNVIDYIKKGVRDMFIHCLFRNENHFIECYREHFPIGCDSIEMKKVDDNTFHLSVDFGDVLAEMDIKTHISARSSIYVIDAIE